MHVHCCNTLFPYNFLFLFFIVNPMAFKIIFFNLSCSYWWLCFMHCNEKSFLVVHCTIYFAFSLVFVLFLFEFGCVQACVDAIIKWQHSIMKKIWIHCPYWWIWNCTCDKKMFVCNVLLEESHKSMNVVC
jgi:hypothetical protein